MINITVPSNNINERRYIVDILFGEFLGLDYKFITNHVEAKANSWIIELENGNRLTVKDHFFSKYTLDLEYLDKQAIPNSVDFGKNKFIVEEDMPIIFGDNSFSTETTTILCGIDIFASSFFMLTRWEEYVNTKRDEHDRSPASESLAFKNNFLDRPIVNEYVEMLWNMLSHLGINQMRKTKCYEFIVTHDVDDILMYRSYKDLIRRIGGDIVHRKSVSLALKTIKEYIGTITGLSQDPYDTFDWIMDQSERAGVKSHFFFMAEGQTKHDNRYSSGSPFVRKLVKKIKNRGHYIGIHSSYNTYKDISQFKKEKSELEKNLDANISFGRAHYLRFEVPTTWQIWEDNGMQWDSSVGYANKEGFRCGTGDEFSVFNILTQKKLHLKERPLVVMESSMNTHADITPEKMENLIKNLTHKAKKYKGRFVFLWHNSNFNTKEWEEYRHVYQNILEENAKNTNKQS